jgi:acetyl esterase
MTRMRRCASAPAGATTEVDAPLAAKRTGLDPRYLEIVSPLAAIDPDALRVLEMGRAAGRPPVETQTPPQAREAYARGRSAVVAPPPEVAEVRDIAIGGGPSLRFYRGLGAADPSPALLYLHGGGWVLGDLDSHDSVCRILANAARCRVLAVDYRLAPEHPFPAALEDALAAARWLHAHAGELGVDATRIGVGGDSAGANLAAVLALLGRDGALPAFGYQALIYPVTDLSCAHDAHRREMPDIGLTPAAMRWFIAHYLGEASPDDWRVSPLRAESLAGTPPAFVVTAGHDPLCDEGEAYARRLADEGEPVTHRHLPDQIHGFVAMGGAIAAAGRVLGELGLALARHWRTGPAP